MILNLNIINQKYNLDVKGVIHVGAHYGREIDSYIELGIKNIVLFEPLTENFNVLSQKVNSLDLNDLNIESYKIALGNMTGHVDINLSITNELQSSSILNPKLHLEQHPSCIFVGTENVVIDKLDSYNYQKYNLLNMDVQGYELEVLKGAKNTLNYIDYVYTEVNSAELYENNALIEELDNFLLDYNFMRVETSWWPDCSWGDAFYIKNK